jgi:branched-subunit amino acid transport protein
MRNGGARLSPFPMKRRTRLVLPLEHFLPFFPAAINFLAHFLKFATGEVDCR